MKNAQQIGYQWHRGILCAGLLFLSAESLAAKPCPTDQAQVKSRWVGSDFAVSGSRTRGNSNTTELNGLGKLIYTALPWKSITDFSYDYGKTGGTLNTNRYTVNQQVNYYAHPKKPDYIFGLGAHMDDRLGPFRRQNLLAVGVGRDLLHSKKLSLSIQTGPGIRVDKPKSQSLNTDFVITSKANFAWHVTDEGTFKQELRYDHGFSTYGFLKSTTAFSERVIGRLSMQVSYVVNYYTRLPSGLEARNKKDTKLLLGLLVDID